MATGPHLHRMAHSPYQATGKEPSGVPDLALARLHISVTAGAILWLVGGFPHCHEEEKSSISLRKGKCSGRPTFMNRWLILNHTWHLYGEVKTESSFVCLIKVKKNIWVDFQLNCYF